jgi:hypothetical protein
VLGRLVITPRGWKIFRVDLISHKLIAFGLLEYTLVDSEHLLTIPEDVDPAEAAPILCAGE